MLALDIISGLAMTIIILNSAYIVINILKYNGLVDIELSQTSSMVMERSGKLLLKLQFISSLFFLTTLSNDLLDYSCNDGVKQITNCKLSFYLEYFGYEFGKLFISILLIYRLYSSFDNTLYHISKQYIKRTFFIILPILILMYFSFTLYIIIISDHNSYKTWIISQIISWFRLITFDLFIGYQFISRLYKINLHSIELMTNTMNFIKSLTTKTLALSPRASKLCHTQQMLDVIQMTSKHSHSAFKLPQIPSTTTIVLEADSEDERDTDNDDENENEKETKTENKKEPEISEINQEELYKDPRFNMQDRKHIIIKYVILIVIMTCSSILAQVLMMFRNTNKYLIYMFIDIIIHSICSLLLLWIADKIWNKLVHTFHRFCLCQFCCPMVIMMQENMVNMF